jgi:hypothetical protein
LIGELGGIGNGLTVLVGQLPREQFRYHVSSSALLSGAHGTHLRRMPSCAEAGWHYDANVHPQGDRSVGRADQRAHARRLHHNRKRAHHWEDIEPFVAQAVRDRAQEFQQAGIAGVDLYLASFGPALEEFSRHWPLKRGTPRPTPEVKRRRKQAEMFEDEWDPYAVTPEDALDAARREVKRWRLEQLTHMKSERRT